LRRCRGSVVARKSGSVVSSNGADGVLLLSEETGYAGQRKRREVKPQPHEIVKTLKREVITEPESLMMPQADGRNHTA
jgi:hypothetical protein